MKNGLLRLNTEACFHRLLIIFLPDTDVGELQHSVELGPYFWFGTKGNTKGFDEVNYFFSVPHLLEANSGFKLIFSQAVQNADHLPLDCMLEQG